LWAAFEEFLVRRGRVTRGLLRVISVGRGQKIQGQWKKNQERLVLEKPLSRRMFLGGTKGNAIGKL